MIISGLGFALMGLCVKIAGARGFPIMELIFARSLVSLILCYIDIQRLKLSIFGQNTGLLWLRGIIGFLALIAVYKSLTILPLAEATLIQYLHPIFTAIFAWFFLGERIQNNTILCVFLGCLGTLILSSPGIITNGASLSLIGLAVGLIGAAGSGLAYTLVRHLSYSEHPSVIILYFPLVCLPLSFIFGWNDFIIPRSSDWLLLIAIGFFTHIGQMGLTLGMSLEKAANVAAYGYVQVVFAAMLGVFVLSEKLSMTTLLGTICILGGLVINQRKDGSETFTKGNA